MAAQHVHGNDPLVPPGGREDARRSFAALRRRLPLIVACAVLAAAAAAGFSLTQTNQYSAEATLLFRDPGFDRLFGTTVFQTQDPDRAAATNVGLASLQVISDLTAADLQGRLDGDDVFERVSAESDGRSDLVSVTATDPDPKFAARMANSFATNYIEFRQDADREKVREAIALIEADLASLLPEEQSGSAGQALERKLSDLQTLEALQTGNAELVQNAEPPTTVSSPKTLRNTVLAGFLGLLLGGVLAALFERLDRKLRDPNDFEEAFGLPVLTMIPKVKAADRQHDVNHLLESDPEAFHMLRTRLRYFNVDRDIRVVLVTSSSPGDGKSAIAWNLASSAASAGVDSIVVEADFHRPTLAERSGAAPLPGLSEVLTGQSSLRNAIHRIRVGPRGEGVAARTVDLLVAGTSPPNTAELLESDGMHRLIGGLRANYEFVVIDTPPISRLADAIPLIPLVDGVIVIGRFNGTMRDEAVALREQLEVLEAPTLGVVANWAPRRTSYYGYAEAGNVRRSG